MDNEKDKKDFFFSAKIEKLAAALYLVTNQLIDPEPLKWKLREIALQSLILKDLKTRPELIQIIENISNLLDLAVNSGSVSLMNFTLLKNEYKNLVALIEQKNLNTIKDSIFVQETPYLPEKINQTTLPSNTNTSNGQNLSNIPNGKDKELRQSLIAQSIRGRGWMAIKDIAKTIPDCSVKTVQRELAELVDQGVLKKKGERRWSRYMLAA